MEERDADQKAPRQETKEQPAGTTRREFVALTLAAATGAAITGLIPSSFDTAEAQTPACSATDPFPQILEIASQKGKLQAILRVKNTTKNLPGFSGNTAPMMRYFEGQAAAKGSKVWPDAGQKQACLPGPTLSANIGDQVEISFFNEVNVDDFAGHTLDNAETGFGSGCDLTTNATTNPPDKDWYPGTRGDSFPNCFHGSSSANLHFHGMHVTPDGLGDNVLVQVRPDSKLDEAKVQKQFAEIFALCEKNQHLNWRNLPGRWSRGQQNAVKDYDLHAIWKDQRGPVNNKPALPVENQLAPVNDKLIMEDQWPVYFIGAYPNCFKVTPAAGAVMGQAPGTHWYHAHKHGSTSINLYNGMAGVLLIRGDYDQGLKTIYPNLKERVMIVQRFTDLPNLERAGGATPITLVNGQPAATIQMAPGEVQLWRIVNGMVENSLSLSFTGSTTPLPLFRQIAQDGIQFRFYNYANQPLTAGQTDPANPSFKNATAATLVAGGRIDVLVQAPAGAAAGATFKFGSIATVVICGNAAGQSFPTESQYKLLGFPDFLNDLPQTGVSRQLIFGWEPFRVKTVPAGNTPGNTNTDPPKPNSHTKVVPFDVFVDGETRTINANRAPFFTINGKRFEEAGDVQTVALETVEEWVLINTTGTPHPFHIHVNPFQVLEVFDPNPHTNPTYKAATGLPKNGECLPDPALAVGCDAYAVWQDVVLIPAAKTTPDGNLVVDPTTGVATTPGRVRIRSRFCDFPGTFVLHCHILAHEDRGMMQLVQVAQAPGVKLIKHH